MKKKKVLIIHVCKERLHELEFVKPICDVLEKEGIKYFVKNYKDFKRGHLMEASHIIICGTSLKDNEYVAQINYFRWISELSVIKPILGICAGMQIIGMAFDLKRQVLERDIKKDFKHILKKKTEIGFFQEEFKKYFLGLVGKQDVYHLHNNYINFEKIGEFEIVSMNNKIAQAIKHKKKEIYGCLFHPEVRQKEVISRFVQL